MNYTTFRKSYSNAPFILSRDVLRASQDRQAMRNQLSRWVKKGLIMKLRQGVYMLEAQERKVTPGKLGLAGQLYGPSYISLESALSFYGLIPERVSDTTSVTTKKTMRFHNSLGDFIYQHSKPAVFRGFRAEKDEAGLGYFIAEPEKAVVDFLYLRIPGQVKVSIGMLAGSYRFQNVEMLKSSRIIAWARLFHNKKLLDRAKVFVEFMRA